MLHNFVNLVSYKKYKAITTNENNPPWLLEEFFRLYPNFLISDLISSNKYIKLCLTQSKDSRNYNKIKSIC